MLNDLDRFHLVIDVIDRVPGLGAAAANLRQGMVDERLRGPHLRPRSRRGRPRDPLLDLALLMHVLTSNGRVERPGRQYPKYETNEEYT